MKSLIAAIHLKKIGFWYMKVVFNVRVYEKVYWWVGVTAFTSEACAFA